LGDLALGVTSSYGGDDRLATKCLTVILLRMATSEERRGFELNRSAVSKNELPLGS
jgi:hypothetical protein